MLGIFNGVRGVRLIALNRNFHASILESPCPSLDDVVAFNAADHNPAEGNINHAGKAKDAVKALAHAMGEHSITLDTVRQK